MWYAWCGEDCCVWQLISVVFAFAAGVWYLDSWEVSLSLSCSILWTNEFISRYVCNIHRVWKKTFPTFSIVTWRKISQILIIFDTNVSDTTGHQVTFQFPTTPNVCFWTTWGKQNQQHIVFLSKGALLLDQSKTQKHFVQISVTLAGNLSKYSFFNCLQ